MSESSPPTSSSQDMTNLSREDLVAALLREREEHEKTRKQRDDAVVRAVTALKAAKSADDARCDNDCARCKSSDDRVEQADGNTNDMETRAIANADPRLVVLDDMRTFLKKFAPTGQAPDEESRTKFPRRSERAPGLKGDYAYDGFEPQTTQVVDAFLFPDDDAIDDAIEAGILGRAYCSSCSSWKDTQMLQFISHSFSEIQLRYVMATVQSWTVSGPQCLVDIGSRLGVVLYAAHLFTSIPRIVGIESNPFFQEVAGETIRKYNLGSRVTTRTNDVRNEVKLLGEATCVVMNNVFEWFADTKEQNELWEVVLQGLSSGAILVTSPSVEQSIVSNSLTLPSVSRLEQLSVESPVEGETHGLEQLADIVWGDEAVEDCEDIAFYRVR